MIRDIAKNFRKPEGFFGRMAARIMANRNMREYDCLIDELNIRPGFGMLEIGFGPGRGLNKILSLYSDCRIDGIDFSELMLIEATECNREFVIAGRLKLRCGDFLESDCLRKAYDRVFCVNVVYFWDDLNKPFSKVFDALKPGGEFCFYMADIVNRTRNKVTETDIFNKHSIESVEQALRNSGFDAVDYKNLGGYFVKAVKFK